MSSFNQLQSLFAAYQASAIGFGPTGMQNMQGAVAPPANDDQFLWDIFNTVPTPGPLFHPSGHQFFDGYAAVINSLVATTDVLDPVAAAKEQLKDWGDRPPAWDAGYAKMKKKLDSAQSLKFSFGQQAEPHDGFWGLWAQSEATPGIAARFAAGEVSATVEFRRLLNFAPTPADWYVQSAISYAYKNPDRKPWNPASPITWETAFGPNGTLRHIVSSLVCVSGVSVKYASSSPFTAAEQDEVKAQADHGLWPYYLPKSAADTTVSFDGDGTISVNIVSKANTPIVIGVTSFPADKYFTGR